jgi:hypothetical protein
VRHFRSVPDPGPRNDELRYSCRTSNMSLALPLARHWSAISDNKTSRQQQVASEMRRLVFSRSIARSNAAMSKVATSSGVAFGAARPRALRQLAVTELPHRYSVCNGLRGKVTTCATCVVLALLSRLYKHFLHRYTLEIRYVNRFCVWLRVR